MKHVVSLARSTIGGRAGQDDAASHFQRGSFLAMAVCDGVGSTPHAAACAGLAAYATVDYLAVLHSRRRNLARFLHGLPDALVDAMGREVSMGVLTPESASTVSAVVVDHGACWVATVGDSRVFHVRDGRIIAASHSDSVAAARHDGRLAEDDTRAGSTLLRWVSASAPAEVRRASIETWSLLPGDIVLLVTDGVTELISPQELARLADISAAEGEDISQRIIERVVERGGFDADNGTVAAFAIPNKSRRIP